MKKKGDAQQQVLMTAAEAKQRLNDALAQKVLGGVVAVDSPQNGNMDRKWMERWKWEQLTGDLARTDLEGDHQPGNEVQ